MSLLTDAAAVIAQMRIAAAHAEGGVAERIMLCIPYGAEDQVGTYSDSPLDYASATAQQLNDKDDGLGKRRLSKSKRQGRSANALLPPPPTAAKVPDLPPLDGPLFEKAAVPSAPAAAATSVLSWLVKNKITNRNAYTSYAQFSGVGQSNAMKLRVWLPFCESNKKPMTITVRPDATVEDVIGYVLYQYTEEGRQPKANDNIVTYSLRIVEDDGEIDNDFPALDRTRQIDRFAFGEFAVTAAPEVKVPEKKAARSVLIRVHLYSTLEIRQTTTLHIAADQTLAEVLRIVCEKNNYKTDEYTLRHVDMKTEISLSLTVEEANINECSLVKKDRHSAGDIFVRPAGESEDGKMDERSYTGLLGNELGEYRRYTVMRRRPMFNVRQERTLAIDGDIIRSMPSDTASAADTANKVTSFDVASVISCTLRGADTFRIVFQRGRDTKVYDYETPEAEEIVARITRLCESKRRALEQT